MKDYDLNERLDAYQPPQPSELLRARILKQAAAEPAKPVAQPRRYMAIAASLLAVFVIGFAGWQLTQPEPSEDIWLEAANDLGVSEIYEWVEGEEGS